MKYSYSIETGLSRLKTNAKKYVISGLTAVVIAGSLSIPALAAGKAAPKATGGVGYTANGLQRSAEFNAHQASTVCASAWNVTGNYNIGFKLSGDPTVYTHDASLTQTGNDLSGSGGYPAGGPHVYEWSITSGNVSNTSLSFSANYTLGADALVPLTVMTVNGTIALNGTMSGTWADNYQGGSRSGEWQTTSGNATQTVTDCSGKGNFHYSDVNGNWYDVDIQYVQVSGNDTWFAGPVTAGNVGAGNWLFAKVHDGGTPGRNGDQVWGSFAAENAAKVGVATMSTPADGPFAITSGNLVVHK